MTSSAPFPMAYSNKTTFGIRSNVERYTWIGYYLVVMLSSVGGDTIILLTSIVYKTKAFRLHESIVVIIQHLAVCDLMVSLTWTFPRVVSLMAGKWALGSSLCNIQPYSMYHFGAVTLFLICDMTITKLIIVKFPMKSAFFTSKRAHQVCFAIWVLSSNLPIILGCDRNAIVFFDYRAYSCELSFSLDSVLKMLAAAINLFVPNVSVVAATALLMQHLLEARRAARRIGGIWKWRSITTIILTASIYSISILPYAVYTSTESFVNYTGYWLHYYRLASSLLSLSVMSNFFIYCLTVPSFRRFLKNRCKYHLPVTKTTFSSLGKELRLVLYSIYCII